MIRMFACGAVLLLASSLGADELRTLGAKTITGNLTAISGADITMMTDAGPVATPLAQVLTVDLRPAKGAAPGARYTAVRLLDDSILHCQSVGFAGNDVELTLLAGTQVKVPINFLSWMVRDAQLPTLRKKFDDILGAEKQTRPYRHSATRHGPERARRHARGR